MKLVNFWSRVEQKYNQPNACLRWQGSLNSDGYGTLNVGGQSLKAHRVAYFLTKGEIPKGMEVCHSCDNPSCCNPNHLWLGTHRQNTDDMTEKERFAKKLSRENVKEIRRLRAEGSTLTQLSKIYGVGFQHISRIVNNICWKEGKCE